MATPRAVWLSVLLGACVNTSGRPEPRASVQDAQVAEPPTTPPPISSNARSPLGINLTKPTYWSGEWVFVDLFKMAGAWVSNSPKGWGKGPRLELDERGWVRALAPRCSAAAPTPAQGPGDYVLLYEGKGQLRVKGPVKRKAQKAGRIEFSYQGPGFFVVQIDQTDPKDPIREIRIAQKALEPKLKTQTFHPTFLERLGPFKTLRFKDWGHIDGQRIVHWKDRTPQAYAIQTLSTGMAYEYMIELANQLKTDVWINIPHQADADFVRKLAALLHAELAPQLKVFVEYSNELWNSAPSFPQHKWLMQRGRAQKLSPNPKAALLLAQAERSRAVFEIFGKVFNAGRLIRVIGSQTGSTWAHEQLMSYPGLQADALAVAPYFGHEVGQQKFMERASREDLNWLLEHLENTSVPGALEQLERSARFAKSKGLRLIAYEGGQHLVLHPAIHNNPKYRALLQSAQRAPGMARAYRALLTGWKRAGGELFVGFNFVSGPSKWGSWGALEHQAQPLSEAPKYTAMLRFAQDHPIWWER